MNDQKRLIMCFKRKVLCWVCNPRAFSVTRDAELFMAGDPFLKQVGQAHVIYLYYFGILRP